MKKYQQLSLSLIAIASLTAVLFYKHSYDRLRYAFDVLETFGTVDDDNVVNSCGISLHRKLTTAPTNWIQVDENLIVYSAFIDSAIQQPSIRLISMSKDSSSPPTLSAEVWGTRDPKPVKALCTREVVGSETDHGEQVNNLLCKPEEPIYKPYLIRFSTKDDHTPPMFIQGLNDFKIVKNTTSFCVLSSDLSVTTNQIIEFVAYHHGVNVEKFVFYGNFLTPEARKLMDRYSDEIGLFYEEKQFALPLGFILSESEKRRLVELDCVYRHRNTHQNVLTLKLNEYVVSHRRSIDAILKYFPMQRNKLSPPIRKAIFKIQDVCVDEPNQPTKLLMSSKIRKLGEPSEEAAMYRPSSSNLYRFIDSSALNIPISVAVIQRHHICKANVHPDTDHLPLNNELAALVKKSILFRRNSIDS